MPDEKSQGALYALKQKFPDGLPDVRVMNDEQKAWVQMKIQSLAENVKVSAVAEKLSKIQKRLLHATEDIPDGELQKMVSFVFENMDEIEKLTGTKE